MSPTSKRGPSSALVVVALVGVLRFRSTGRLRAFLAGLVGADAAKWALALVWFTYAESASAVETALDFLAEQGTDVGHRVRTGRAVAGARPVLDRFVGMAQVGVLAHEGSSLYRGVREADRNVREAE